MSDGASAPSIFIPDFGDMPQGVRFVLTVLAIWADARGSIDATEEELSAYTGMGASTVRRHLAWAAKEARGWVSRSERRRGADGKLSGYRYWLSLEKLGRGGDHRSNRAVARVGDEAGATAGAPVGGAVDEPPLRSGGGGGAPPLNPGAPPPASSGGWPDSSGGEGPENAGLAGLPRERARAAFPLPSSSHFLSFPWRDDAMRDRAGAILAVCGEGLGLLGAQGDRVLKSLAYVLEPDGLWAGFDLSLDILPVVKRKTGPGRSSPLWDFALLTENLERHRAKRLRPAGAPKAAAPKRARVAEAPVRSAAETRAARIETLRHEIRLIDAGNPPDFLLPKDKRRLTGAWRDDAFAALRAAHAEELAGLESFAAETATAEG